jgi:hypothetical protein
MSKMSRRNMVKSMENMKKVNWRLLDVVELKEMSFQCVDFQLYLVFPGLLDSKLNKS